ncbi:MAG TPA: response regulator transcription factor [Prolixibacteraceae bacterium]|nr:response regulator transcription factor [Prolixibacteraceae bacterium]HUM89148.1 response regulator transcription factor [Prolixibacteraceae bacterium]
MELKCIVADDEPLQQEILKDYIGMISGFELIGVFGNGNEALSFLKEHKTDLVFLDISMPGLNGVELVKRLSNPPAVIFTTAYPEYAVEGFNLNAVDYLLKPISFERFSKAIEKFSNTLGTGKDEIADNVLVKSGKKEYRIKLESIYYIESMGDYIRLVTATQAIITHGTMLQFLNILPANKFCRIHKSFTINLDLIDYFEGNIISLKGKKLSVGKAYREDFLETWRK